MGKYDVTKYADEKDRAKESLNLLTSTQTIIHDALKKLGFQKQCLNY